MPAEDRIVIVAPCTGATCTTHLASSMSFTWIPRSLRLGLEFHCYSDAIRFILLVSMSGSSYASAAMLCNPLFHVLTHKCTRTPTRKEDMGSDAVFFQLNLIVPQ